MRVLFIGDIVGRKARNFAQKKIVELKSQLQLDAVIVNVENAAGGFGVTPSICDDFFSAGADVLTTGNHIWDKREIISYIAKSDRLLRPLNMIKGTPGLGMTIIEVNAGTIGVAKIKPIKILFLNFKLLSNFLYFSQVLIFCYQTF